MLYDVCGKFSSAGTVVFGRKFKDHFNNKIVKSLQSQQSAFTKMDLAPVFNEYQAILDADQDLREVNKCVDGEMLFWHHSHGLDNGLCTGNSRCCSRTGHNWP